MVIQKLFVVLFVLANLILPFVVEEIFPITTAPMFRDSPTSYCDFRVIDPEGQELPLADFGLQRNYDGNPIGYGSGRLPADSLDRFGSDDIENIVPHRDEIVEWVGNYLGKTKLDYVTVQVKVVGPVGKRIDVTDSWEIVIPNDPEKYRDPLEDLEEESTDDEISEGAERNETDQLGSDEESTEVNDQAPEATSATGLND